MSKVTKKVEKWLVSVIQPQYFYKDATYSHIYHFLVKYFPLGFKIRTAVFTSDLGKTQLLINLHGNLQTQFDKFGISVWIPHNYPYADNAQRPGEPNGVPLIYVIPLPGTSIRQGNNVDAQGKIYHPYLTQWHSNMIQNVHNDEFLLVRLIDILVLTFSQLSPVGPEFLLQGPDLPPKPIGSTPSHVPLQREYTGPELPAKPQSSPLPLKETPARYRAPLPLPNQVGPMEMNSSNLEPQLSGNSGLGALSQQSTGLIVDWNQGRSSSYSPINPHITARPLDLKMNNYISNSYTSSQSNVLPSRSSPVKLVDNRETPIEDLMDKISIENDPSHGINRELLEKLATQINKFLDPSNRASISSMISQINEYSARVYSLREQLEHHNNQARANEENLTERVKYLQERVSSIRTLNTSLEQTEYQNSNSLDSLVVNPNRTLSLDEIATLDLIMLHQLYQVCADIKAYKDTISLVAGNFKSEAELINDFNLEDCVKAIRSVSRDLFWLEVTRQEIAKVMSLDNAFE